MKVIGSFDFHGINTILNDLKSGHFLFVNKEENVCDINTISTVEIGMCDLDENGYVCQKSSDEMDEELLLTVINDFENIMNVIIARNIEELQMLLCELYVIKRVDVFMFPSEDYMMMAILN